MILLYVVLAVLTVAVLAVAVAVAVARLQSYKATHPHTEADLVAARKKSVASSRSTVTGQVKEHLVPLLPEWPYNPRDANFLGQPIDYIVFEGLDEDTVSRVLFVEVKTGTSSLKPRQRSLRDAIKAGRVDYEVVRLDGYVAEAQPLPIETSLVPADQDRVDFEWDPLAGRFIPAE